MILRLDLGSISVKGSAGYHCHDAAPGRLCLAVLPGTGWPWTPCNGKGVFVPACPRALELIAGIERIDRAGGSGTACPAQRLLCAPGTAGLPQGALHPLPPHPGAGLITNKAVPASVARPMALNNRVACARGSCVESSHGAISLRGLRCATWLLHSPVHSLMQPHKGLGGSSSLAEWVPPPRAYLHQGAHQAWATSPMSMSPLSQAELSVGP